MQARPRGRGAAGALAALACVCTVAACANSAPAPHELERAGGTVYSQAQVMVLVAEAAMRGDAPRPALGVMLDDAAQTLDDERQKIAGLTESDPRTPALLRVAGRLQDAMPPLMAATESGDPGRLSRLHAELEPAVTRLEALGLS
ncbi:hypothetical protein [Prauserella rugosa]|uniref:Lipoprotein n=1 Tax=Prauserella rugosa TaxID=43354 RepID=A0A660CA76_9PSEU|nr:hypothetical protein [Prauserella rugosa]KID29943.1 hypothetical protein HQ32_02822 [Prauserella sp. Am3]KMS84398.1 hypothetical protein ACZ91_48050 [Streptomyces regensis]TWH18777.1 hypothetical protein JD82_00598 [Prauserella rugosa]